MQGIEFEEDKNNSVFSKNTPTTAGKPSFMMMLLGRVGISDKTTASFILLGVAMIFFGVTIFLYAGILGGSVPSKQDVAHIAAQAKVLQEMQNLK